MCVCVCLCLCLCLWRGEEGLLGTTCGVSSTNARTHCLWSPVLAPSPCLPCVTSWLQRSRDGRVTSQEGAVNHFTLTINRYHHVLQIVQRMRSNCKDKLWAWSAVFHESEKLSANNKCECKLKSKNSGGQKQGFRNYTWICIIEWVPLNSLHA